MGTHIRGMLQWLLLCRIVQDFIFNFYLCTMHFEIYVFYTPTNALFINLVKSSKFTLKYAIISLLHVSVFDDHHQGALSVPMERAAALNHAVTSPNLYNDVILPRVLT